MGLNLLWRGIIAEVYATESWPDGTDLGAVLLVIERKKNIDQLTEDWGSYLNEVHSILARFRSY